MQPFNLKITNKSEESRAGQGKGSLKPLEEAGKAWLFEAYPGTGINEINKYYAARARESDLISLCVTREVREAFNKTLELFEKEVPGYAYHNLRHVLDVFLEATRLSYEAGLSDRERELLQIAALFHDAGYADTPADNEEMGALRARRWMARNGFVGEELIVKRKEGEIRIKATQLVSDAILATRVSVKDGVFRTEPKDIIGALLCDADMASKGREDFWLRNYEMKNENGSRGLDEADKVPAFLNTPYHTGAARAVYDEKRLENLKAVKEGLAGDKD